MKMSVKLRNLTIKDAFLLVSYIALLILGLIYFEDILSLIGMILNIFRPFIIGFVLAFV